MAINFVGLLATGAWPVNSSVIEHIAMALIGGAVILVMCIASAVKATQKVREREQTTRELAAYIAEGSMTPEIAERLIHARTRSELHEDLAKRAADGWITAKTVDKLMAASPEPRERVAKQA